MEKSDKKSNLNLIRGCTYDGLLYGCNYQGPIVQSIVSLMSLLRGELVKCFRTIQ